MADTQSQENVIQSPTLMTDQEKKRLELIQNMDFNEIPPFMVEAPVKSLQMTEDSRNDWRLTEFMDENKAKLAVKVWCQGFMFNDRIRMMVAEKYVEAMISHKRKGKTEHIELTRLPQPGQYDPNAPVGEAKKQGLFQKLKRIF